jgi:hypothetical protein
MPDYEDTMLNRFVIGLLSVLVLQSCGISHDESSSSTSFLKDDRKQSRAYPMMPHKEQTPGELCDRPTQHRYAERIAYCERDVDTQTKQAIIKQYDQEFGYHIGEMPRSEFKIDHYYPLCAGGSNSVKNLWPQHKTVYELTDPIEQKVCILMQQGDMLQAEAIEIIDHVKFTLNDAIEFDRELDRRIRR